jgi:hypothetical protein
MDNTNSLIEILLWPHLPYPKGVNNKRIHTYEGTFQSSKIYVNSKTGPRISGCHFFERWLTTANDGVDFTSGTFLQFSKKNAFLWSLLRCSDPPNVYAAATFSWFYSLEKTLYIIVPSVQWSPERLRTGNLSTNPWQLCHILLNMHSELTPRK